MLCGCLINSAKRAESMPAVKQVTEVKTVTGWLPAKVPTLKERRKLNKKDTLAAPVSDLRIQGDTAKLAVEREQAVYADSTVQVWASGQNVKVDSARALQTTHYVLTTVTVSKYQYKVLHWGIVANAGWDPIRNQASVTLGLGVLIDPVELYNKITHK